MAYLNQFKCECTNCGNDNFFVNTEVVKSVWHHKGEYVLCIPMKITFTCKNCGNKMEFEDEFQQEW